jgi:hypothetical protein
MNESQLEELLHLERLQAFFQQHQLLDLREENCRLREIILALQDNLEEHGIPFEITPPNNLKQLSLPFYDEITTTKIEA